MRHPDDLGLRIQTASRFSSLNTIGWLVAIGATVAFLVWFHRAYVNLSIAHGTTMYAPGWAIGVWFIPVLNLWRPYFMTSELCQAPSTESQRMIGRHDLRRGGYFGQPRGSSPFSSAMGYSTSSQGSW